MRRKQSPIAKLQRIVEKDAKALNDIEQKGEIGTFFAEDELDDLLAGGFLVERQWICGDPETSITYEVNRQLLASTEVIEDPIDKEALASSIRDTLLRYLQHSEGPLLDQWISLGEDIVQLFYAQDPLEASHRERLSRMLYGHGTALWEDIFVQVGQLIEDRGSGK